MRLQRREHAPSWAWATAGTAVAVWAALVAVSLVAWAGKPVGLSVLALLQGGFGSVFAWTETLTRATPLMFTGLAAALAFRAKLYNIGAEGQLYAGAIASVAVASLATETPAPALWWPLMGAAAGLAGGLLLLLPAWLKHRLQVDEVVTTLLLNFVVLLGVGALLDGPMKDPGGMGWPQSVAIASELELPKLIAQTRLHAGLLLALVCALGLWLVLQRTVLGFDIRATGANARAAHFVGVPIGRTVVLTALMSGALAGLGGAIEVAGRTSYVTLDMSPGYGMAGVVVAMLAGLNPLGVVAMSVAVAGLQVGADSMSRALGVPTYLADVVVAASLLGALVASALVQFRLVWRRA